MEKEFIPYEQALDLKELGFDEPCFGYYDGNRNLQFMYNGIPEKFTEKRMGPADSVWVGWISALLYQQAFRWFREKYKLHSRVFFDGLKELEETDEERYDFDVVEQWTIGKDYFDYSYGFKHLYSSRGIYMSYEEAELECLKKLIEIVKRDGR